MKHVIRALDHVNLNRTAAEVSVLMASFQTDTRKLRVTSPQNVAQQAQDRVWAYLPFFVAFLIRWPAFFRSLPTFFRSSPAFLRSDST